tara:strand:- start:1624 stop:4344 length:2721 start_codon:yes stop_codon:yes gene_type:complete
VYILLAVLLFTYSLSAQADFCSGVNKDSHRICYISLNNSDEFRALKKKYEQTDKVEVFELMTSNTDPSKSIMENFNGLSSCSVKPPCSSIVIGGHQNGSFWGDLVEGELTPADLLLMQCENSLIKDVSTVWLQGCNTIDEDIDQQRYDPQVFNEKDAVFEFSELKRSMETFRTENTDENSIVHNDRKNFHVTNAYSAAFPRALVHGWEGIAPGTTSSSVDSMILHLQQSIEFLLETGMNARTFEEANRYLQARKSELEGRGLSREINRDFLSEGDFMSILKRDLDKILSGEQYRCLWEVFQSKYYGTGDRDLRRPKSIASAYSRGFSPRNNICDTKNLLEKHISYSESDYKRHKDSTKTKIQEEIDKMFRSNKGMDQNLLALEGLLNKFSEEIPEHRRRKQVWQKILKSNKKIEQHILNLLSQEGITLSRKLEIINLYENLTGISISAGDSNNPLGLLIRSIENSNLNESIQSDMSQTLGEYEKVQSSTKLQEEEEKLKKIPTFEESIKARGLDATKFREQLAWCKSEKRTSEEVNSKNCVERFDIEKQMVIRERQKRKITQIKESNTSQILDFAKLVEEAVEGGRVSKKSWEEIEKNLDKMPAYLRKRILYLASKEDEKKLSKSLSRKSKYYLSSKRRRKVSPGIGLVLKKEREEAEKKRLSEIRDSHRVQAEAERVQPNYPVEVDSRAPDSSTELNESDNNESDNRDTSKITPTENKKATPAPKAFKCKAKKNYKLNRRDYRNCLELARGGEANGILITCLERGKSESGQSFDPSRNPCVGLCENVYYSSHRVKKSVGDGDVNLSKVCEKGFLRNKVCHKYKREYIYKYGGRSLLGYDGYSCHNPTTKTNFMCDSTGSGAKRVRCKTFQCGVSDKLSELSKNYCYNFTSQRACNAYAACEWTNK